MNTEASQTKPSTTLTLLEQASTPADLAIHNLRSMLLALSELTEEVDSYQENREAITGLIGAALTAAEELSERVVGVEP